MLTGLRIWDGLAQLDADTLVVHDGRIAHAGALQDLEQSDRRSARSLHGCTALPGLIDCHVHLVLDPDRASPPRVGEVPDLAPMRARALAMVRAGITTARDLGGGAWRELALRDEIARGDSPGPRLICAGQPITCPGGHCHFWGGEAADATAAARVVRNQAAHGVDLIKVIATGGRFTRGSSPVDTQFDDATLQEIVATAHSLGLPVAAHCHGTDGIAAAARAGVQTIEHCSWAGREGWASDYRDAVARLVLERDIRVSATVNSGWQRILDGAPSLPRIREAFSRMRALGIGLLASTDAGIPGVYHHDLPAALGVFAQIAGLTPEQALVSATSDAALGLGLGHLTGRLARGLAADVLVVDGHPPTDLASLGRAVAVWADGREIAL